MSGWQQLFVLAVGAVCYVGGRLRSRQKYVDERASWKQACEGWKARALAAEAKLRGQQLAPVVPFTYQPSMAQQRHGLKVVEGGRR